MTQIIQYDRAMWRTMIDVKKSIKDMRADNDNNKFGTAIDKMDKVLEEIKQVYIAA